LHFASKFLESNFSEAICDLTTFTPLQVRSPPFFNHGRFVMRKYDKWHWDAAG